MSQPFLSCVASVQPYCTTFFLCSLVGRLLKQCGSTSSLLRSWECNRLLQTMHLKLAYQLGVRRNLINSPVLDTYLTFFFFLCSNSSAHCCCMCSCWFKVLHQSFLVSIYSICYLDEFNTSLSNVAVEQHSGHFGLE